MTSAVVGRVLGSWVLRSPLGGGGMSEVFAAEHRDSGAPAAVKVLRAHLAADEAQAARFVAEATRTRAIDHPNVVRVLEGGRADDGTLYLVMERIDGEDLAARLKRVGRLDEAELRRLGAAVADGMQAAHERGVIHRDLKPANILVGADGAPKIVDFGIAKLLAGDGGATGPAMGTPHYMAPEQIAEGAAAPSVDVWALGVTLFEAATGTLPFSGFSDGRVPQLVDAPPRPGERAPLSTGLEALILQCLKRSPSARPATMREIAARLRDEAAGLERSTAPLAPPPRAATGASATVRTRRWRTRVFAASVVLALAGGAAWLRTLRVEQIAPATSAPTAAATTATVPPPVAPTPAAVLAPTAAPIAGAPSPTDAKAHPRSRHHAAHHSRSRVYGEKLD
jgi:serine/threonine-protein kinase